MSLRYDAICALSIVTDIIHRICHVKGNEIFYLSLKRNVRTRMAGPLVRGAIQLKLGNYGGVMGADLRFFCYICISISSKQTSFVIESL